jgi:hypothetical protein
MRQKGFVAHRKQQKRRKRAKQKVKLYEKQELKFSELPRLAKKLMARKRRQAARTAA